MLATMQTFNALDLDGRRTMAADPRPELIEEITQIDDFWPIWTSSSTIAVGWILVLMC